MGMSLSLHHLQARSQLQSKWTRKLLPRALENQALKWSFAQPHLVSKKCNNREVTSQMLPNHRKMCRRFCVASSLLSVSSAFKKSLTFSISCEQCHAPASLQVHVFLAALKLSLILTLIFDSGKACRHWSAQKGPELWRQAKHDKAWGKLLEA